MVVQGLRLPCLAALALAIALSFDPVALAASDDDDIARHSRALIFGSFGEFRDALAALRARGSPDAAAAMILASEKRARDLGLDAVGYLSDWAYAALDGRRMGLGPVYATAQLVERTGVSVAEYDLVELNEAFASAACAVSKEAGLEAEKTNVNGGAVALGHPIGASGARILTTLLYAMKNRDVKSGMASLCLGGGNAVALSVRR